MTHPHGRERLTLDAARPVPGPEPCHDPRVAPRHSPDAAPGRIKQFESANGIPLHIASRLVEPRPDCWIWTGGTERGYGRVLVGGKVKRVHRVVYEALAGAIPEGMELDHLCRVRACCNPSHLELVAHDEHSRRTRAQSASYSPMPEKQAGRDLPKAPRKDPAQQTHCVNGHEWTPENTRVRSEGGRKCRECDRAYHKANREQINARKRARRAAARAEAAGLTT